MKESGLDTNLGKWERWYQDVTMPDPYGDVRSYQIGAEFLKDCKVIEDWGCGKGWFKTYSQGQKIIGIDGTKTIFSDVVADLVTYKSRVPGIFIRHVLEHDYKWGRILTNALDSFTQKMVLILFTPLQQVTKVLAENDMGGGITVPDIGFSESGITNPIRDRGIDIKQMVVDSKTQYGIETIFLLKK